MKVQQKNAYVKVFDELLHVPLFPIEEEGDTEGRKLFEKKENKYGEISEFSYQLRISV